MRCDCLLYVEIPKAIILPNQIIMTVPNKIIPSVNKFFLVPNRNEGRARSAKR